MWHLVTAQCPTCRTWWRTVVRLQLGLWFVACPACGVQRWRAVAPGGHVAHTKEES